MTGAIVSLVTGDFDLYARDYDSVLDRALSPTGETREYFARLRVLWLARRLEELRFRATRLLDYGCGTGGSAPYFFEIIKPEQLIGLDVSPESLAVARERGRDLPVLYELVRPGRRATGSMDLAFCNGVFHHIAPGPGRAEALGTVFEELRVGGLFAFWENNPLNPAVVAIMRRTPFDRDARTITPGQARRMLRQAGFEILGTDFLFFFPRFLAFLRRVERRLCKIPLGGQYLVLCRRP